MESNFTDKEMRDKLKSVEFPFDPKAWEQMEVMLDKEKKRRGIFWWWFGGVAACLVLAGGIGYESMHWNSGSNVGVKQNTKTAEQHQNSATQPTVYGQPAGRQGLPTDKQAVPTGRQGSESSVNNSDEKAPVSSGAYTNNRSVKAPATTNETTPLNYESRNAGKKPKTNNTGIGANIREKEKQGKTTGLKSTGEGITWKKAKQHGGENEALALASKKNKQEEEIAGPVEPVATVPAPDIYLAKMNAAELEEKEQSDKVAKENKDEDVVLPKKQRIFHYSAGFVANCTFTSLGTQPNHPVAASFLTNSTAPRKTPRTFFYRNPSYAVGFTHDFMFGKRFAITNSFEFSQTSFQVFNPYYKVSSTELDIPIGLKVYPVSKPRVRFYIEAGVINHIVCKETFSYNGVTPLNASNHDTLVPTSFIAANYPVAPVEPGQTSRVWQYYASFYASSGVEFIVKKHFVFFAAPLFYMSLNPATESGYHKYNIGLDGGFRYQF